MVVDLPEPFGPEKAEDLAARHAEAHVVHRDERPEAPGEVLRLEEDLVPPSLRPGGASLTRPPPLFALEDEDVFERRRQRLDLVLGHDARKPPAHDPDELVADARGSPDVELAAEERYVVDLGQSGPASFSRTRTRSAERTTRSFLG